MFSTSNMSLHQLYVQSMFLSCSRTQMTRKGFSFLIENDIERENFFSMPFTERFIKSNASKCQKLLVICRFKRIKEKLLKFASTLRYYRKITLREKLVEINVEGKSLVISCRLVVLCVAENVNSPSVRHWKWNLFIFFFSKNVFVFNLVCQKSSILKEVKLSRPVPDRVVWGDLVGKFMCIYKKIAEKNKRKFYEI